jgi:hypothetical protein
MVNISLKSQYIGARLAFVLFGERLSPGSRHDAVFYTAENPLGANNMA